MPKRRLSELLDLHTLSTLGDHVVVRDHVVPVRDLTVGAHREAEELLRSWDVGWGLRPSGGDDPRGHDRQYDRAWQKSAVHRYSRSSVYRF